MDIDANADRLHQQGKIAESNNAPDIARVIYGGAIALLGSHVEDDAVATQRADILRAYALSYIHEARNINVPPLRATLLENASQRLIQALDSIDPVIEDDLRARLNPDLDATAPLSTEDRAHVYAVRGAALGVLACARTFGMVSHERFNPDTADAVAALYREAHNDLRQGNNGLYRVKNAVAAARHQALFGNRFSRTVWLGRATHGVLWTQRHDPNHYQAARQAFKQRNQSFLRHH